MTDTGSPPAAGAAPGPGAGEAGAPARFDAATTKFPYVPAGGYTQDYLDSREFIHVEMAEKLDDLSVFRGPVGVLLTGAAGAGKTTVLQELRDIAARRHGGFPTVTLAMCPGQSVFKALATELQALLDGPKFGSWPLRRLRAAVAALDKVAEGDGCPAALVRARFLAVSMAVKKEGLALVLLIDDLHEASPRDLEILVHGAYQSMRDNLPMLFVLAGAPGLFRSLCAIREDAPRYLTLFEVHRPD